MSAADSSANRKGHTWPAEVDSGFLGLPAKRSACQRENLLEKPPQTISRPPRVQ